MKRRAAFAAMVTYNTPTGLNVNAGRYYRWRKNAEKWIAWHKKRGRTTSTDIRPVRLAGSVCYADAGKGRR